MNTHDVTRIVLWERMRNKDAARHELIAGSLKGEANLKTNVETKGA